MGFTVVKGHYPRMGLDGKEHLMLSCKIGALGTAEIEATDSLITNLPTFKDANGLTASILDMYMLSQGVTDLAGLAKIVKKPFVKKLSKSLKRTQDDADLMSEARTLEIRSRIARAKFDIANPSGPAPQSSGQQQQNSYAGSCWNGN